MVTDLDRDLAVEIAQMHRDSRRETLRQSLRSAALLVTGGAAGLVTLPFGEITAVLCAIAVTALVASWHRKR